MKMHKALSIAFAVVIVSSFASSLALGDGTKSAVAKAKVASKLPAKKGAAQRQLVSATATKAPAKTVVASTAVAGKRGVASVSDSNSALEVTGQSRNLSMMLTLRNKKNDINFVKPRENYSNEIQNTSY